MYDETPIDYPLIASNKEVPTNHNSIHNWIFIMLIFNVSTDSRMRNDISFKIEWNSWNEKEL